MKTSLVLPDDLKHRIERLSSETGTSEAELLRRAIREFADRLERRPLKMPLFASRGGRDVSPDSSRVDELLRETGFGET